MSWEGCRLYRCSLWGWCPAGLPQQNRSCTSYHHWRFWPSALWMWPGLFFICLFLVCSLLSYHLPLNLTQYRQTFASSWSKCKQQSQCRTVRDKSRTCLKKIITTAYQLLPFSRFCFIVHFKTVCWRCCAMWGNSVYWLQLVLNEVSPWVHVSVEKSVGAIEWILLFSKVFFLTNRLPIM